MDEKKVQLTVHTPDGPVQFALSLQATALLWIQMTQILQMECAKAQENALKIIAGTTEFRQDN